MLVGEIFFIVIVIWTPCILCDRWDDQETRRFVEQYIPKLQLNLIKADDNSEENYMTSKTIIKNNRHYDVHLIKLRNVNGLKRHNLIVKEKSDDNPLIYVINPVETKIPNAYISQTEFKDILYNRVKQQRKEVYKNEDPLLPSNTNYWTKKTWSDPTLRSTNNLDQNSFEHQYLRTRFSKNTRSPKKIKTVTKSRYKSPPIPYIHYLRDGNSKTKKHIIKKLRSNRTSQAISNKAITLKNNGTIKAKIIYLRSNRSIINTNKKILQNLSTKPTLETVSDILKKYQNISITEKISKAEVISNQINETIERQTTTKKIKTENELPVTKNKVASTTEVFTTIKQSTEEVTSENPTNSDITTDKIQADDKTKIKTSKIATENTEDSKNERETTENSTDSEITSENLTAEDKTTAVPNNTETGSTEHFKEENESIPTEETVETTTNEDTTTSYDNTVENDNNTESVNTVQEADLATDQSKVEEATVRKPLPYRTTVVKKTTTKAPVKTKRTRLSRPLVFMGEMGNGNGNSWK